ncbi:hypothetical protein XENOCAPTIV_017146 [Xenoophorus captivus]|uniref:Uncharacterized protein n=1 Tax=Xenoophorus captivus TaxID=1517983 RepID=A0ABV0S470_9TELE
MGREGNNYDPIRTWPPSKVTARDLELFQRCCQEAKGSSGGATKIYSSGGIICQHDNCHHKKSCFQFTTSHVRDTSNMRKNVLEPFSLLTKQRSACSCARMAQSKSRPK